MKPGQSTVMNSPAAALLNRVTKASFSVHQSRFRAWSGPAGVSTANAVQPVNTAFKAS
ncbi:MAG: hypothetical protein K2X03_09370 [Bryobacteraceae bacterium]|nr:hypothetical protein [Bryobacteraceae bacterium]